MTPSPTAYLDGLKMLARRELSEAQLRQRLTRHGHPDEAIDAAIARLKDERALDDTRVAAVIARTATTLRPRGRHRVTRQIESSGIDRATARRAVDDVFAEVDEETLLLDALRRRLRGRDAIADDGEFRRLYRYLIGQGFEADAVLRVLSARRGRSG